MPHDHADRTGNYDRSFALGVALNGIYIAVEAGCGIYSGSLALVADAGHNLSDVVSLLLAWGASALARKAATEKRTYGFRKATVIASLASAILLLITLGGIAREALGRFSHPQPVAGEMVIVVAAIGVVINTLTALLFVRGKKHDLNIKGAFLHMAADAAVSLGVVVAGIVITVKGWLWVDPGVSLVVVAVILVATWGLLRDSINHMMDVVPDRVDIVAVRNYLMGLDRVSRIHDLHVWPLSTTEIALTVHLVVNGDSLDNDFLRDVQQQLHDHHGIEHATIQVEAATGQSDCMLDSHKCV